MSKILIRFVTERDPVSAMIRAITDSHFSHVEFVLDADWTPYLTMEQKSVLKGADYGTLGAHFSGGIKLRPTDYAKFTDVEVDYIEVTPEQKTAVIKAALAAIGTPYDVVDIAGILFHKNWHECGHEICSFFVTSILVNQGIPFLRISKNLPSITPRDCYLSPLPQRLS